MAALIPIISEAGGKTTSLEGGDPLEDKSLVTTNGLLHEDVLKIIN
jgi:histidinol-phosphatase